MRFGIKIYSTNIHLFDEVLLILRNKKADYLELTYFPGTMEQASKLRDAKVPIVIHALTSANGYNLATGDPKTHALIAETLKAADYFNASHVIIHPDVGSDPTRLIEYLKTQSDSRITLENMPYKAIGGGQMLGATIGQMKELLATGPFGFCLDFGHAAKTAASLGDNYKMYIKQFMELQPIMYHINDGYLTEEEDEHLDIGSGEYDFPYLKSLLSSDDMVTFEVNKTDGMQNDLLNIERFKQLTDCE